MNISDVVTTFSLYDDERSYLNDFLELGWRIIEMRKHRTDDEAWEERITFILGAVRKLPHPKRYTDHVQAQMPKRL